MYIDKPRRYTQFLVIFQADGKASLRTQICKRLYGDEAVSVASDSPMQGRSLMSVSEKFGIDRRAPRRHQDCKVKNPGSIKLGQPWPVLP